jgi:hypothetical protein
MLVKGLTLKVSHAKKAKDINNTFTALCLGIVREEAVRRAMVGDKNL